MSSGRSTHIRSSDKPRVLPWLSLRKLMVTPPPSAPCSTNLSARRFGDEVALDGTAHQRAEVECDSFGRDLGDECVVRGAVVGEEGDVADVALVAGADAAHVSQLAAHHASSTWTCTSTASRSTKNGVRVTSSLRGWPRRDRPMPCSPGGPDNASSADELQHVPRRLGVRGSPC